MKCFRFNCSCFIIFILVVNFNINLLLQRETNQEDEELSNYKLCKRHCEKLNLLFECNCDLECSIYNDCCDLNLLANCSSFHSDKIRLEAKINKLKEKQNNKESLVEESCCSDTPPKTCSCDSNCINYKDCCYDYEECKEKKKQEKDFTKPVLDEKLKDKITNKTLIDIITDNN